MAASITGPEPRHLCAQEKIDLLLIGDVTVQYLADTAQKLFSNIAKVTVTIRDVKEGAALLSQLTFNVVFLTVTLPTAPELEAVKLIRFGKKKNAHLLFVLIVPENFKGCVSGHGADITLTEPLTMEKLSIVVKYWKTYFSNTVKNDGSVKPEQSGFHLQKSCSEHLGCFSTDLLACSDSLRNDIGLELKTPFSDIETSKRISLLHSSKEKLRRERIRRCCQQLRALLPSSQGRKTDAASILEATVDYVKYVREKLPRAALGQITDVLQSDQRFCKKQQAPPPLGLPGTARAQRENGVLASSPVQGLRFLANQCLNVYSVPASGGPLDGAVRGRPGAPAESPGDVSRARAPGALALSSFHAVRYFSAVIPSCDAGQPVL
ncbi:spermatogenesis- and oogenesis-specific basic helix-loop-helix-containing protein 2 [Molossus molossus]|uniref:spermatogenesis- and oogenesis-specific basic helix-loop-helix-containing protein 2 n=1 Tax=Molossus molossus TaxID=27622 RepID=UPI00174704D0|nr:spermatogenesis- and oogenesis-specific basic helix-loop-helix-containing protein 2 [Molossus molossus]